jgi:hypothetical protein
MGYKPLVRTLIIAMFFLAQSLFELYIQMEYNRPLWCMYVFGFCVALFIFLIAVVLIDLITKDIKEKRGKIVEIHETYFKVQINNKCKKFSLRGMDLGPLEADEEYTFIFARRSGALLRLEPVRYAKE